MTVYEKADEFVRRLTEEVGSVDITSAWVPAEEHGRWRHRATSVELLYRPLVFVGARNGLYLNGKAVPASHKAVEALAYAVGEAMHQAAHDKRASEISGMLDVAMGLLDDPCDS